ncbi:uncharacterized protein [Maniola hyperantus]|uniref:uncharacterized protein isoform X1 n=1 Tax=Aphantopus hyperantus TaxID=2795564 RepID=UPI00374A2B99
MSKKYVSKIPIPVYPLPPISKSTLKRNQAKENGHHPRKPLETIYEVRQEHNINSDSGLAEIDTQHVTIRQNNEDLHLNTGSRVEDRKVVTSRLEPLLESVKSSHDQELVSISATTSNDKGDEKSARAQVFTDGVDTKFQPGDSTIRQNNEDLHLDNESRIEDRKVVIRAQILTDNFDTTFKPGDSWRKRIVSIYNDDYGQKLMMREETPKVPNISTSKRAAILNWLAKINHGTRKNYTAVQTAAWYFDTIISVSNVDASWLQVVAAVCYWKALKIYGTYVSTKKMVRIGGKAYSAEDLKIAEDFFIKLELPIYPVVAQDYIQYLSWVCDSPYNIEIQTAATLYSMAAIVLYKTLNFYPPSLAAAAAIYNALNLLHKQELLEKLANNAVYQAAKKNEDDFSAVRSKQTEALGKMVCPNFQYRALLETDQLFFHDLTQKILDSVCKK